jgi:transposase
VRVYECPVCGLVMDRDHNPSVNIEAQACGRAGHVIPEALGLEAWRVVTLDRRDASAWSVPGLLVL